MSQENSPSRSDRAREVLAAEIRAIESVASLIDGDFNAAVDLLLSTEGTVVVTGMGKAGLVGAKISATLASTGTRSFFLDPAQALHGDLGRMHRGDLCLALSNSGTSEEIVRLLPHLKRMGIPIVAITSGKKTLLGQHADIVLELGRLDEACPLGLAPTASATAMMALGDALAMVLVAERGFTAEDFALFHPGGELGRKLVKVREIMRRGEELPLVTEEQSLREVVSRISETPRNPGAAIIVDGEGRLAGFYSDGDLRRTITSGGDIDQSIRNVMTPNPKVIQADALVSEAMNLLTRHQIDQIIVVDDQERPIGLLDQQDVLAIKI